MIKKKQIAIEYLNWLFNDYSKYSVSEKAQQLLEKTFKKYTTLKNKYDVFFLSRLYKLRTLKLNTFVDPVNYICTVFKITSIKEKMSINYGFLYSMDKSKYIKYFKKDKEISQDKLQMVAYCIAPSLSSMDGEYRDRMTNFPQFDLIMNSEFGKVFLYMEKYMINKIEQYDLQLEYENFYPMIQHESLSPLLDSKIINKSLMMNFLIYFWLSEIYNVTVGLQENHMNIKFNQLIFTHLDQDIKQFKNLIDKFGNDKILELIRILRSVAYKSINGDGNWKYQEQILGQKLRPLNVNEVQDPLNVRYAPWREIYFNNKMNNFIANGICPNVPIFLDWFYIKNSRRGLFDNPEQIKKMEDSERALNIVRKLRESQHITKNINKEFYNDSFRILSEEIEVPIDYSKTHILMSNVTLCNIVETVGRTFNDLEIVSKSKIFIEKIGGHPLKDFKLFSKFIWDLVFCFCCMNVKNGLTHSDPHLNNITINNSIESTIWPPGKPQLWEIYHIGGGTWFKFPKNKTYAYVIDFSRGTIFEPPFDKENIQYKLFHEEQIGRMLGKLRSTFPSFTNLHYDDIRKLIIMDYEKFYKFYSCIDLYEFSSKLAKRFSLGKQPKENIKLITQIHQLAEHQITNVMLKSEIPGVQLEWPNISIAKECFSDFLFSLEEKDNIDVVSVWDIDRELKFDMKCWNKFPTYIKEAHTLGLSPTDKPKLLKELSYQDYLRKKYEKYRQENMSMIQFIAERHKLKYELDASN